MSNDERSETLASEAKPMSAKQVTAQDFEKFKDAIVVAEVAYEASMDEAASYDGDNGLGMADNADDKWHNAIRRLYDSVRQEARREALKEMDEAYALAMTFENPNTLPLQILRSEYQGK